MDRRRFLDRSATLAASAALCSSVACSAEPDAVSGESGPVETSEPRSDVHALVLGTVQDAGLPQVGCYSDRCNTARTAQQPRYVASLALVEPNADRYYLVDATPDITRQIDLIQNPGFRRRAGERRPFDGIFLTHAHIGHYTGLAVLGNEGLGIRDTPVFCTQAMADFLGANQPWAFLIQQGRIVPTPLSLDTWHTLDELLSVRLLKVPHRDEFADTVGFEFRGPSRTLLYVPDINSWEAWERSVAEVVSNVDVALLDGSFYSLDELPGRSIEDLPHPLMGTTMDALQQVVDAGDSEVVLTHLNNSNPALDTGGPQQAEIARRGFGLAREGMRFELG